MQQHRGYCSAILYLGFLLSLTKLLNHSRLINEYAYVEVILAETVQVEGSIWCCDEPSTVTASAYLLLERSSPAHHVHIHLKQRSKHYTFKMSAMQGHLKSVRNSRANCMS